MLRIGKLRRVGLLVVLIQGLMNLPAAVGQAQHTPPSHAQGRFALAADTAFQKGVHAKLPPHISTLLGVSKEQEFPVMQGVVRTPSLIQGFDVSVANQNDIVLFVVDGTTNDQTFFLTSPNGTLRKVVAVKGGVGNAIRITDEERKVFEKEKQFWVDRLAPPAKAK